MKNSLLFFLISIVLILGACNSTEIEKKKSIEKISRLEIELVPDSTSIINQNKAIQLIELYHIFSSKYNTDSLAPEYLFKAGELAMNLNHSTKAIIYLNRFEKEFQDHNKMPYCIFFQAFIYENQMNNLEKAKQYYQRFINDYPSHELVDDAETSIKNLGRSLEDIIKDFEEKNK